MLSRGNKRESSGQKETWDKVVQGAKGDLESGVAWMWQGIGAKTKRCVGGETKKWQEKPHCFSRSLSQTKDTPKKYNAH